MKNRFWWVTVVLAALTLTTGLPALGGTEANLGDQVDATDNTQVFIAVLARYFEQEPDQVSRCLDLCGHPDDLAVILFLATGTGRSPEYLLTLRNLDLGWWDISQGMNVTANDWFIPIKWTPRPPYYDIYRAWDKSVTSLVPLVMKDEDCSNLVAARILFEYFETSAARAMEIRENDGNLARVIAKEYRRRQATREDNDQKVVTNTVP